MDANPSPIGPDSESSESLDLLQIPIRLSFEVRSIMDASDQTEARHEHFIDTLAELQAVLPEVELEIGEIDDAEIAREHLLDELPLRLDQMNFTPSGLDLDEISELPLSERGIQLHRSVITADLTPDQAERLLLYQHRNDTDFDPEKIKEGLSQRIEGIRQKKRAAEAQIEEVQNLYRQGIGTGAITAVFALAEFGVAMSSSSGMYAQDSRTAFAAGAILGVISCLAFGGSWRASQMLTPGETSEEGRADGHAGHSP